MSKSRANLEKQSKNLKEKEEKDRIAAADAAVALAEDNRLQREEPERYVVMIKDKGMDVKSMRDNFKEIKGVVSKLKKGPLQTSSTYTNNDR
jgi:biotin operon repressor